jgi:hypothetical protein
MRLPVSNSSKPCNRHGAVDRSGKVLSTTSLRFPGARFPIDSFRKTQTRIPPRQDTRFKYDPLVGEGPNSS